jgi:hypothetical protein
MSTLRIAVLLLLAACVAAGVSTVRAQERLDFPAGESVHELHGFTCAVNMPAGDLTPEDRGLLFVLHGYGDDAQKLARSYWWAVRAGYIVVVPVWQTESKHKEQVESFHAIVRDVRDRYEIPDERLHCLQDADGYNTLPLLAFSKDPAFRSATWTRGHFSGGKVPKHVRDRLGTLAVIGAGHRHAQAVQRSPKLLIGKVRHVDVHLEEGESDRVPLDFMKRYFVWWLRLQEGAYTPGDTLAFSWGDEVDGEASFTYWWSAKDAEGDDGRTVQTATLHDPLVQFYGDQVVAVIREREKAGEEFEATGATTTPAIVVHDKNGKRRDVLEGAISAKDLTQALRAIAPEKKKPW